MLKKGYSDLASKLLLSVKSLFTQYVATREVDILSKETDGKKNDTNIKRKRKRQAAPYNSQDSSESDSLSTPASQSPPRSDDENGRPPFSHAMQSKKRPRILGRRFKVGTRITKVCISHAILESVFVVLKTFTMLLMCLYIPCFYPYSTSLVKAGSMAK